MALEKDTVVPNTTKASIVRIETGFTAPKSTKAKKTKQRELVRFTDDEVKLGCLEDEPVDSFDQFKDKKTSYDFNNYTSNLDESKITAKQRLEAERIEKELNQDESSKKIVPILSLDNLTNNLSF